MVTKERDTKFVNFSTPGSRVVLGDGFINHVVKMHYFILTYSTFSEYSTVIPFELRDNNPFPLPLLIFIRFLVDLLMQNANMSHSDKKSVQSR